MENDRPAANEAHGERQTKLLENIQTLLVLLTTVVVIGVVVWLASTFGT